MPKITEIEEGSGIHLEKKRLRDMTWDDYRISKHRYQELKAFCLQYDEKKNKIRYGLSSVQNDGTPTGGGAGRPTERQAIDNEQYKRDCLMIEEAAVKANPGIWKYILKSVTLGLPYEFIEYDEDLGRITVGKTDFYAYRKLFYHFLDLEKLGIN